MHLYVPTYTFGILLYLISSVFGSRFCQWSKETAEAVSFCPLNKRMLEVRANIKNCEAKAGIQNCTIPDNFKYHCVMNELETEFVEVCAPAYYVHGHCTEYNSLGAAIQEHYSLRCSDVKPPCNTSYLSTDAYLFKGCLEIVGGNMQMSSTEFTTHPGLQTNHLLNDKSKNTYMYLLIIISVGVIAAAAVFISVFLIVKYTRRSRKKIEEDLTKVQLFKLLLSLTKDEEGIPIENRLTAKPMAPKRQFEKERLTVDIE